MYDQDAKILIVDDLMVNRVLLTKIIEKDTSYTVLEAEDGEQALEKILKNAIDLILLDIMMPVMDGFELAERLKSMEKVSEIPIIFITSLNDTVSKLEAFEKGGVDYISKPFNKQELLSRINAQLKIKKLHDELIATNKRIENELELARNVHNKMLSFKIPKFENYNFYTESFSINGIGGDFVQIIELSGDKKGIVFADVSGHGVAAALMVSSIKFIINSYFKTIKEPSKALYLLNDILNESFEDITLSIAYFVVDDKNKEVVLSSSSQENVLLIKDKELREIKEKGLILGVLPSLEINENPRIEFKDELIKLNKNDILIFYTDGLVENNHMDREKFLNLIKEIKDKSGIEFYDVLKKEMEKEKENERKDDTTILIFEGK